LIAAITALMALPSVGQNVAVSKATLGPSTALLSSWNEIGRKLIAMAEVPEAKTDAMAKLEQALPDSLSVN
jgi:hypothetical protein